MKNFTILALGFIGMFLCKEGSATELQIAKFPPSLGFTFGGDFSTTGDIYSGRDPRFQFGPVLTGPYFAFPITFSFGQDVMIMGNKPQVRAPIMVPGVDGLSIAPGLGPILNWWHYTGSLPVDADVLELGIEFNTQFRYDPANAPFYFAVTPFSLDFNFWRYIWANSDEGGESKSNSTFGMVYNLLVEIGVKF